MELTRRRSLRMLLTAPLALLSPKAEAAPSTSNCPKAWVRGHCAICRHYEPPRLKGLCLDGPPDAYCTHQHYCKGHYLCGDLVRHLGLHRAPNDSCNLFRLRKDLEADTAFGHLKSQI